VESILTCIVVFTDAERNSHWHKVHPPRVSKDRIPTVDLRTTRKSHQVA